jgi:hypothetical protein
MATERERCTATRRDGSPCRGDAIHGGQCFAHSDALQRARREGQRKGGRNSAKVTRLRALVPPRLLTVYDQLEAALADVLDGSLDPKQAHAAAALARALVAVLSAGELEQRVRDLEAMEASHG